MLEGGVVFERYTDDAAIAFAIFPKISKLLRKLEEWDFPLTKTIELVEEQINRQIEHINLSFKYLL